MFPVLNPHSSYDGGAVESLTDNNNHKKSPDSAGLSGQM